MTVDFYKFEDIAAPVVQVDVGGKELNLLVDTGGDLTFIDSTHKDEIKYTDTYVDIGGVIGVTSDSVCRHINKSCITINGHKYPCFFVFNDIKSSFDELYNNFGVRIHGMIGSIFLKEYGFVLDFDKLAMYTQR